MTWIELTSKIVINNDKFFDFFYVNDLVNIIKLLISDKLKSFNFEFDLVYKEKLRLSQIANLINELSDNKEGTNKTVFSAAKNKSNINK